jgi:hypothetical protein
MPTMAACLLTFTSISERGCGGGDVSAEKEPAMSENATNHALIATFPAGVVCNASAMHSAVFPPTAISGVDSEQFSANNHLADAAVTIATFSMSAATPRVVYLPQASRTTQHLRASDGEWICSLSRG